MGHLTQCVTTSLASVTVFLVSVAGPVTSVWRTTMDTTIQPSLVMYSLQQQHTLLSVMLIMGNVDFNHVIYGPEEKALGTKCYSLLGSNT